MFPDGEVPNIVQRAPDALSVLILVSANIGIAVLPYSFKAIALESVVMRELAGAPKYAENVLVYRAEEDSPVVLSFIETVRKGFKVDSWNARST